MKKKNLKRIGRFILLITAAIWGLSFVFQRDAMNHMGPFSFVAARMTLASIAVWVFCIVRDFAEKKRHTYKTPSSRKMRKTVQGGILCGIFLAAASNLQQVGLVYTTACKAGFLTALYIIIVPAVNTLIFRKPFTKQLFAGCVFGVAGLWLLSGMSAADHIGIGDIYVIGCALCYTAEIITIDRYIDSVYAVRMSAIQFTVCAVIAWILALSSETPSAELFKEALVSVLYCGFISGGLAYTFQMIGQKYVDPTAASLIVSSESLFAVAGGVLILGESMSREEMIGCIFMIAAIIIVQVPASFGRSGKGKKR